MSEDVTSLPSSPITEASLLKISSETSRLSSESAKTSANNLVNVGIEEDMFFFVKASVAPRGQIAVEPFVFVGAFVAIQPSAMEYYKYSNC